MYNINIIKKNYKDPQVNIKIITLGSSSDFSDLEDDN